MLAWRGARSEVAEVAAHHVRIGLRCERVIARQHRGASGYQAGIRAGRRRSRREACTAEVVPVVVGGGTREIFAERDGLRTALACAKRAEKNERSPPEMFGDHHNVLLLELVYTA